MTYILDYHQLIQEISCNKIVYEIAGDNNNQTTVNYNKSITVDYKINTSKNTISVDGTRSFLNDHLARLLTLKYKTNIFNDDSFYDVLSYILDIIPEITTLCTICGDKLSHISNDITSCLNDICKQKITQVVTDNFLCNEYMRDPKVFMFLLETATLLTSHKNRDIIFDPFPSYFFDKDKNFLRIQCLFKDGWKETLEKSLKILDDDYKLYDSLGKDLFCFVKFVIYTNNTRLVSKPFDFAICGVTHDKNKVTEFVVSNTIAKEKQFETVDKKFLFHGSSIENWYGILRHGIKNCSGTALMAHGQAYGSGIYLSDNFATSFGYSGSTIKAIGVFQVLDDVEQYKKNTGFFVVPDEKKLLLKYLLITSSVLNHKLINNYYNKTLVKDQNEIKSLICQIGGKRLLKEISNINKLGFKNLHFTVDIIDDNICHWTVKMLIKNTNFVFDIKFANNYPIDPPFIRLISPVVDKDNGFILESGILCLKWISPKSWTPMLNIETLLVLIKNTVDNLQIKIINDNLYDEESAKSKYDDLINNMNWN